ncbi:MAG: mechanosensitive ion channel family protein [Nanoarchaeota archaeon]
MGWLQTVYFGNTTYAYILFVATLLIGFFVGKIFYIFSSTVIKRMTRKTKTTIDDALLEVTERPLVYFIFIAAFYVGIKMLVLPVSVEKILVEAVRIAFMIDVTWLLIRFVNIAVDHMMAPLKSKTGADIDTHMLPVIKKIITILIIIIGGIMIISQMGFNVASLLTGLGLGGLAFALAAQDLLSNLFGGMAILSDKPFKIGDRIKMADADGYVTRIGLRSTTLETLAKTQVIIPNSLIAKEKLENVTREPARRIMFDIGVEYSTSAAKLEKAKRIIEGAVRRCKYTRDDCVIAFAEFADSSLNIKVIYWIPDVDYYWKAQDQVNLEIKRNFEKARISFAFPTRTIHMVKG